jgi:hypothetical protein
MYIYKMPMTTRSRTRRNRSKRQIYRARTKASTCRGKISSECLEKDGCKNTKAGKRKSYCRRKMNRSA